MRGRHGEDTDIVVRFDKNKLNYKFVLAGSAAIFYSVIAMIRKLMGMIPFTPKQFTAESGLSRATVNRHLSRLVAAGALKKEGYGLYLLAEDYEEAR